MPDRDLRIRRLGVRIPPGAPAFYLVKGLFSWLSGIRTQDSPTDAVKASDVVITMGCGDTCPYYPGERYEDRELDDPAGQDINHVRPIRDEIKRRVEQLISELQLIS